MKKRTAKALPPDAPSPVEEQNIIVLILTPVETDKVYTGLGKLPAEAVEELRAKVQNQVGAQRELVKSFYRQPSVQALVSEADTSPDAIEPN
jgi:hypothetical protein